MYATFPFAVIVQMHGAFGAVSNAETGSAHTHKDIAQVFMQIINVGEKIVQIGSKTTQNFIIPLKADVLDEVVAQCFQDGFNVQLW